MLIDEIAAEFQVLKLVRVARLDELIDVAEVEGCVDAALTDPTWQVIKQFLDLTLAEAWLLSVVVQRKLEIPEPLETAHVCLQKLRVN